MYNVHKQGVRKVTTGITGLWQPSVHSDLMPHYMVLLINRMVKWLPKPDYSGTVSGRKITCRRLDYWSRCCKQ
uniref:Uncharacterized protein n=1 Tax=Onchocerca volvulus TaxID=6282 RepID=A0A8R1TMP8_ONCVO